MSSLISDEFEFQHSAVKISTSVTPVVLCKLFRFYARKQLLPSARLSHRNSVCLSVRPSVRHTGGSVKNGAS